MLCCPVCMPACANHSCCTPRHQLQHNARRIKIARLARRYHKVKFFERKKANRKLQKAKKQLEKVRSFVWVREYSSLLFTRLLFSFLSPLGSLQAEKGTDEYKNAEKLVAQLKLDVEYVQFFPRDQKYVSLYPNNNADDPRMIARFVARYDTTFAWRFALAALFLYLFCVCFVFVLCLSHLRWCGTLWPACSAGARQCVPWWQNVQPELLVERCCQMTKTTYQDGLRAGSLKRKRKSQRHRVVTFSRRPSNRCRAQVRGQRLRQRSSRRASPSRRAWPFQLLQLCLPRGRRSPCLCERRPQPKQATPTSQVRTRTVRRMRPAPAVP